MAYRAFERNNFPEDITIFPSVISVVTEVVQIVSVGKSMDLWTGISEFYIAKDTAKSNWPKVLSYFGKIKNAAAGTTTLNGTVSSFVLGPAGNPSIVGPVPISYGSENPHLGLIVNWFVKEDTSDEVSGLVSA